MRTQNHLHSEALDPAVEMEVAESLHDGRLRAARRWKRMYGSFAGFGRILRLLNAAQRIQIRTRFRTRKDLIQWWLESGGWAESVIKSLNRGTS